MRDIALGHPAAGNCRWGRNTFHQWGSASCFMGSGTIARVSESSPFGLLNAEPPNHLIDGLA